MKNHIQDVIDQIHGIPVSIIGAGNPDFPFICMDRFDFIQMLNLGIESLTPEVKAVKSKERINEGTVDEFIKNSKINEKYVRSELEDLRSLMNHHPTKVCGGGSFGPLTILMDIVGIEKGLRAIRKSPIFLSKLLDYLTDVIIALALEERKNGAGFYWVAEPVASLLSPKQTQEFCGKYLKRIFESCQIPGFLHVCGNTMPHTDVLVGTGAQVLSIDYCTDLHQTLKEVPRTTIVMGNLSPMVLRYDTAKAVEAEITKALLASKDFSNYILSTGCSVIPETPQEHINLIEELVRR